MIVIYAAGNERIGIGNLIRCQTLVKKLSKSREKVVYLYEISEYMKDDFYVEDVECYKVFKREEGIDRLRKIMKEKKQLNSLIITDLLDQTKIDGILYKNIGFNTIVHLNDNNLKDYEPDVLINGDIFQFELEVSSQTRVFSGPQYHMIKENISKARKMKPWKKNKVSRVLVCFGGSDPASYTEYVMEEIIKNQELRNIKFDFVVGPGFEKQRISNLIQKEKPQHIELKINPLKIEEEMIKSDLVITLGGITTYEAMCIGTPVAAFEWKYMSYYVRKMSDIGVLKNLGNPDNGIKKLINLVKDSESLKHMAHKAWRLIDGTGTENVAKIVLDFMK